MAVRLVRVKGKAAAVPALRPETFGEPPAGVIFPPGTGGFIKVTSPERQGEGTYLGFVRPPTSDSAARRLALPADNQAREVRHYRASGWLVGNMGTIAGSPTKDLQLEVRNPEVLEEVSRWSLIDDVQARLYDAATGAAIGAVIGLLWGSQFGNHWLGLLIGIAVGFLVGLLAPTDWADLFSLFLGAADVSLVFTFA